MPFIAIVVLVLIATSLWKNHPGLVIFVGLALSSLVIYAAISGREKARQRAEIISQMTPDEREQFELRERVRLNTLAFGPINPALVCSHCTIAGQVRSQGATRSSRSVTNTIGKVSATTTHQVTQRHCDNCQTTWDVQ